jgi:hypothetical protein
LRIAASTRRSETPLASIWLATIASRARARDASSEAAASLQEIEVKASSQQARSIIELG